MREELGHEQVTECAGDLGGVIAQDMSLRFEGLVERLCLFNTIPHGCQPGAPAPGPPPIPGRRQAKRPNCRP